MTTAEFCDRRIEMILSRPEMFGGLEAVEFQLLTLVEVKNQSDSLIRKYVKFCKECGNGPVYFCGVKGMTHQKLCERFKEFLQRP